LTKAERRGVSLLRGNAEQQTDPRTSVNTKRAGGQKACNSITRRDGGREGARWEGGKKMESDSSL